MSGGDQVQWEQWDFTADDVTVVPVVAPVEPQRRGYAVSVVHEFPPPEQAAANLRTHVRMTAAELNRHNRNVLLLELAKAMVAEEQARAGKKKRERGPRSQE